VTSGKSLRTVGLLAGAALAVVALAAADRRFPNGTLFLDGAYDEAFVRGFSHPAVRGDRVSSSGATIRLPGFGAEAPVLVRLFVASGVAGGQVLDVELNGRLAGHRDLARGGRIEVEGFADREGTVVVRFFGPPPKKGAEVAVGRVEVESRGRARVPTRRLLAYAAVVLVVLGWCGFFGLSPAAILGVLAATVLGFAASISAARVLVLGRFETVILVLAAAVVLAVLSRRLGLRTAFAAVVALTFALRLLLTLEPAFPAIDETFHAHRVTNVHRGKLVTSAVAGARHGTFIEIPYPPAFHVLLAPFVPKNDTRAGERAVRLAMALFEGTAPLLLVLIARRGGASALAAGLAAAFAAAMPESLLVVAKGIGANIAGSWVTLLAVLAVLAQASPLVVAGTMALGFLAHPGAAASLGGLVAAWLLWRARAEPKGPIVRSLIAIAVGAVIAFAVYYREVLGLTLRGLEEVRRGSEETGRGLLRVEWVYLGKVIQNLLLKFGGGPVVLAVVGLRVAPEPLRTLLRAWLGVAVGLALLAVFSPIALRFEYFAAPAVALAAGCGAAQWWETGRRSWVWVFLGVALGLQLALGWLLLEGRFPLRNVIIPGERWPWVDALVKSG
jgi:hypothetical protein